MLNNEKIKVMTKLALYEHKKGKEDIRMGKYYKTDYVRLQVLKAIVNATIGYALILLLIAVYNSEYIISKAFTLNFARIGQIVLGVYIIVIAVYIIGSIIGYSVKYDHSRKHLAKYYKPLKKLNNFYSEDNKNEQ